MILCLVCISLSLYIYIHISIHTSIYIYIYSIIVCNSKSGTEGGRDNLFPFVRAGMALPGAQSQARSGAARRKTGLILLWVRKHAHVDDKQGQQSFAASELALVSSQQAVRKNTISSRQAARRDFKQQLAFSLPIHPPLRWCRKHTSYGFLGAPYSGVPSL